MTTNEYPKCPNCNAWMNGETHLTKPCKITKGELLDALTDLVGAFAKARTMRAPAGHYDEDIYYNGIDLHAQIENARAAIAKATA